MRRPICRSGPTDHHHETRRFRPDQGQIAADGNHRYIDHLSQINWRETSHISCPETRAWPGLLGADELPIGKMCREAAQIVSRAWTRASSGAGDARGAKLANSRRRVIGCSLRTPAGPLKPNSDHVRWKAPAQGGCRMGCPATRCPVHGRDRASRPWCATGTVMGIMGLISTAMAARY